MPVDAEWRNKACSLLGITDELSNTTTNHYDIYNSAIESTDLKFLANESPAVKGDVLGDGNCLFRAISHVVTGGHESFHTEIRERVNFFNEFFIYV